MLTETNDCSVQALHRVTGLSYEACHAALEKAGRIYRDGAFCQEIKEALRLLGWRVVHHWSPDTLRAALGLKAKPKMRSCIDQQSAWRRMPDLLVVAPTHIAAFKNGLLQDWSEDTDMPITEAWQVIPAHARVDPPDVIYLPQDMARHLF